MGRVVFVGAGPGDPELITVKGARYLSQADVVVYAGSLVSVELVRRYARPDAEVHDSSSLTLEEIVSLMVERARAGALVVRLKSGDPSIYGALLEELEAVRSAGVEVEVVPGVTAALAAAAVLGTELTLPKVAQTVVITRASARVPMAGSLRDFAQAARIGATLAIYTGVHLIDKVVRELLEAGLPPETPVAVVYKATWPDQQVVRGTLADIAGKVKAARIVKDSVIIVGLAADPREVPRSSVYHPAHSHSFRPARREE